MICPLILIDALGNNKDCVKEKCAWWLEARTTDAGVAPIRVIREEGCAIKRIAEK